MTKRTILLAATFLLLMSAIANAQLNTAGKEPILTIYRQGARFRIGISD